MSQRANGTLKPLNDGTGVIGELMQFLVQMKPLRETLNFIAFRVSQSLSFKYAAILLPQPDWTQMQIEGAYGLDERYVYEVNQRRKPRLASGPTSEGPSTRAYKSKQPVTLPDVRREPTFRIWLSLAEEYGYRSLVSVPLLLRGEAIGALNCYSETPRDYSETELQVLQIVASQAALAIELARLLLEQRQTITQLQELTRDLQAQQATMDRVSLIRQRLMSLVFEGSGFQAAADTLCELLQNPLLIWDKSGRCIVRALPSNMPQLAADAEGWESWISRPSVAARLASLERTGEAVRALASPLEERNLPATFVPILMGQERMAYLGMIEIQSLEEWRRLGLRQGADILALEWLKEEMVNETETRLKARFVYNLVMGQADDRERLMQRASLYGLDFRQTHFLALLAVDSIADSRRQPKDAPLGDSRRRLSQVQAQVEKIVATQFPDGLTAEIDEYLVVIYPAADKVAGLAACTHLVETLQTQLRRSLPETTVTGVFGTACHSLDDFHVAYQEVRSTLQTAHKLGRRNQVLTVETLGMFRSLLRTHHPEDLVRSASGILGPLFSQRSQELYHTLCVYLDSGSDLQKCVEALDVHPNTIRYRLRKVEEVTGFNLSHPQDLLQLAFAISIHRLFDSAPGSEQELVADSNDAAKLQA